MVDHLLFDHKVWINQANVKTLKIEGNVLEGNDPFSLQLNIDAGGNITYSKYGDSSAGADISYLKVNGKQII